MIGVERRAMSVSQFAELVGIEPGRFLDVEVDRLQGLVNLVLEPEDDMAQGSGVFPQLTQGGKKIGGKKRGKRKRGC